jgi:L-fuculose-phosphate aldolase
MSVNKEVIQTLVDICHRLYANRFVTATDGNVSVRLENGNILTTCTAINKGMLSENDLVEVDLSGNVLTGDHLPSTEIGMHLYIYSQRAGVNAVVHAHPPYATGFATAHQSLNECLFPEVVVGLGAIPLAKYATPSTEEVTNSLAPFVKVADAILLSNHGVVTYGKDLWDAYFKMEKVEHAAHITFVARMLGGEKPLSPEDIEKLRVISQQSYGKDFSTKIVCETSCTKEDNSVSSHSDEDIRTLVKNMLKS